MVAKKAPAKKSTAKKVDPKTDNPTPFNGLSYVPYASKGKKKK